MNTGAIITAIVAAVAFVALSSRDAVAATPDHLLILSDAGWNAYQRLHPVLVQSWDASLWSDWLDADLLAKIQDVQANSAIPAVALIATVYAESGGNPQAVGDAGQAEGLIQAHPDWRSSYGGKILSGNVRTFAGTQLGDTQPDAVRAWIDSALGDETVSLVALAESYAAGLDAVGADSPDWTASASARDMLLYLRGRHRFPSKASHEPQNAASWLHPHSIAIIDEALRRVGYTEAV